MVSLMLIPVTGLSQQWYGMFTVDSRAGYTTNTILNPFFGEWEKEVNSGYGFISPSGQLHWSNERYSADLTAGGVFEPIFDGRETFTGGFGLLNFSHRFGSSWSAGLETGGSYFTGAIDRSVTWLQPTLTWSPTLFSQLRIKAGSTFRDYYNFQEDISSNDRFDLYGLEFETWTSFNSQLRFGLYGNMDKPAQNMSFLIGAGRRITNALQLSVRLNADRYSYHFMQEGGGGTGGPPVGGPGGGNNESETFTETDRIIRAGLSGRYQLNRAFAVNLNLDHLSLHSSANEEILTDYQLSVGIQYSFFKTFGSRGKAEPTWTQNSEENIVLSVKYSGNGQLYIVGDFNNWDSPGIPLNRQSFKKYTARLTIPAGTHEYKILLIEGSEERWIDFSDDTYTVNDGFGGKNGLVFIE